MENMVKLDLNVALLDMIGRHRQDQEFASVMVKAIADLQAQNAQLRAEVEKLRPPEKVLKTNA